MSFNENFVISHQLLLSQLLFLYLDRAKAILKKQPASSSAAATDTEIATSSIPSTLIDDSVRSEPALDDQIPPESHAEDPTPDEPVLHDQPPP